MSAPDARRLAHRAAGHKRRCRAVGWSERALFRPGWHGLAAHALLGGIAGMLVLHPVTKVIYGEEWHGLRDFVARVALAFRREWSPSEQAPVRLP